MPFILRIHDLQPKVTSVQAQLNLAECFREHSHLRDPSIIDDLVFRGYEKLIEAEQLFTFPTYLHQFICQDVSEGYFLILLLESFIRDENSSISL